jgi:hypothetical protein
MDLKREMNKTIILGSGESILKLSKEEIDHINSCNTVIAINKFTAFYDIVGIVPTHVYFHDIMGTGMYKLILDKCLKDDFKDLTIVTNPIFKLFVYKDIVEFIANYFKYFIVFLRALFGFRIGVVAIIGYIKAFKLVSTRKVPSSWKVHSIHVSKWNKGGLWAKSFKETIFHFRGSLTSVLNIATIVSPGQDVFLVGNDFTGSKYFHEKELDSVGFDWKDFTFNDTKKSGVHFSFQKVGNSTILDKFPYILTSMKKCGNNLFCINEESLLVEKAGVEYKKIL